MTCSSERQRLAYFRQQRPFDLPAALDDSVMDTLLAYKGVVLDSALEDQEVARRGGAKAEDLRALRNRYAALPAAADASKRKALQGQIESLEAGLGAGVTRRRSLGVTPQAVRQALPSDTALVEFVLYRHYEGKNRWTPRYGAVVLTSEGSHWVSLGTEKEVDGLLDRYARLMHSSSRARLATRPLTGGRESGQVLQELYTTLWSPIEKDLPARTRRVILAPDGRLNFLSFATLVDPAGSFLAESRDLSYVSCGRDLLLTNPPSSSRSVELVYDPQFDLQDRTLASTDNLPAESREAGDLLFAPLPGTRSEGQSLERLFKEKRMTVRSLSGGQAQEASLNSVSSPYILHLATHGFFLPEGGPSQEWNAMRRAGIALAGAQQTANAWLKGQAPDPSRDGILTAEEVSGLKLQGTWLVTLSACDTGSGESLSGEGVLGLRRAVVMAGAENLLMTLWPVADRETADMMQDFYRLALEKGQAAESLVQVQRSWLVRLRKDRGAAEAARLAGPFVILFRGPVPK